MEEKGGRGRPTYLTTGEGAGVRQGTGGGGVGEASGGEKREARTRRR